MCRGPPAHTRGRFGLLVDQSALQEGLPAAIMDYLTGLHVCLAGLDGLPQSTGGLYAAGPSVLASRAGGSIDTRLTMLVFSNSKHFLPFS